MSGFVGNAPNAAIQAQIRGMAPGQIAAEPGSRPQMPAPMTPMAPGGAGAPVGMIGRALPGPSPMPAQVGPMQGASSGPIASTPGAGVARGLEYPSAGPATGAGSPSYSAPGFAGQSNARFFGR